MWRPFLGLFLLSGCAHVPAPRAGVPAARAMSTPAAGSVVPHFQAFQAVQAQLEAEVQSKKLPGVAAMVVQRGEVLLNFQTGMADIAAHKPLQPNTIYRIYSMTKPLTAAAAMMLVEDGKLDLDAPASRYLPVLANMQVREADGKLSPQIAPITIRDLLRHTSGLPYGYSTNHPVDAAYKQADILNRRGTLTDMANKLAALPLRHQPGAQWHYGLSSDVLGHIIEIISNQTLADFMKARLFAPLKMHDTGFAVPSNQANRLANIYARSADGSLAPWGGTVETTTYLDPVTFYSGGGGAVSTQADYLRFCQMLLNGGELDGARVLKAESVRQMMRNQLSSDYRKGYGFGFGGQVLTNPEAAAEPGSIGLYSWAGGGNTFFFIDPKEQLIGMVWTQLSGSTSLGKDFRAGVYGALYGVR